ncbi:hypothetical protein [Metabacillus litoralis]|uniref:hypothetical protein n=1 Tax=Metabacillus litoralis TaxID=152268 RepID=UPI00203CDECE|nr:hypothetical protein [Metabacillus litoralis]MCM3652938.1 hypothetical protein [Metabacillus litoralis]
MKETLDAFEDIIYYCNFSNWLEEWIPLFTFSDEILSSIFLFIGLIKLMANKKREKVFSKLEVASFLLIIVVASIGIISTIYSNINNSFSLQIYINIFRCKGVGK